MKVTEHLARAKGDTLFTFELIPPLKGKSIEELYKSEGGELDENTEAYQAKVVEVQPSNVIRVAVQKSKAPGGGGGAAGGGAAANKA